MSIESKYKGQCPVCRKWWEVGDAIATNDDDEWCHEECAGDNSGGTPVRYLPGGVDDELLAGLSTCSECGYSQGRHSRMCDKAA